LAAVIVVIAKTVSKEFGSDLERRTALGEWLHYYNWHRRHTSLGGQPPITRVLTADKLVRLLGR